MSLPLNFTLMEDNIKQINEYDLEYQYQEYLHREGVSEEKMGNTQRIETKRAFMGGIGQLLVLMRDGIGTVKDPVQGVTHMQNMMEQVKEFWGNEIDKLLNDA